MRQLQEFEPGDCCVLLESFRRWGVKDTELTEMVCERIWDTQDQLRTNHVVQLLANFSKQGVARGGLLRRLCRVTFEQLWRFTGRQLVAVFSALARLRFLAAGDVQDILGALSPQLGKLTDAHLSQILFALAMVDTAESPDLSRLLVVQYDEGVEPRSCAADVDFVWALLALDLAKDYPGALARALSRLEERQPPGQSATLLKMFDVLSLLESEGSGLAGERWASWRAACVAAEAADALRRRSSPISKEVARQIGLLQATGGLDGPLRMQPGQAAGPYNVDLLEPAKRLVVDVERVGWPVSRRVAHRVLSLQGYYPIRLEQWDWKEMQSDADCQAFLTIRIRKALEKPSG